MPQVDGAAFRLTPDLRFLFAYGAHEEAFAKLADALRSGERLLLITGPFGVGKTLLLRRLEATLMQEGVPAAYAAYPQLDFTELLASVAEIHGATRAQPAIGGVVLLDDADRCSNDFLQNLQDWIVSTRGGPHALRFVMAGSPSLASRLAVDFPTLSAMIGAQAQIEPLSDIEADAYIRHRLDVSGRAEIALQADARDIVIHYSRGIPRLINHACARALLLAGPDQPLISQEIAREAIEDYVANASFGQALAIVSPPVAPAAAVERQDAPAASAVETVASPPPEVQPEPAQPPSETAAEPPPPAASASPEPLPAAAPIAAVEAPAPPPEQAEARFDATAPDSAIEIPRRPAADPPIPAARKAARPTRKLRFMSIGETSARLDAPTAPPPKFAGFRQRRAPRRDRSAAASATPVEQPPRRHPALKRALVAAAGLAIMGAALYFERTPDALSVAMRLAESLDRQLADLWQAAHAHLVRLSDELRRIAETTQR